MIRIWHSPRKLQLVDGLELSELDIPAALEYVAKRKGAISHELEDGTTALYCLDRFGTELLMALPSDAEIQWETIRKGEPDEVLDYLRYLLDPEDLFEPAPKEHAELEWHPVRRETLRNRALRSVDELVHMNSRRENVLFALALAWRFVLILAASPLMPLSWLRDLAKGVRDAD